MKLTAISMVKNEEDVIERFLRINSKVIDHFVIYDDNSSDNTVDIINQVMAENKIKITLLQDKPEWAKDQLCNRQETIMHGLRKFVYEEVLCDFIFAIDADEFIFESRGSVCNKLQTFFSLYGNSAYGGIAWKTFIPVNGELTPDKSLRSVFSPMLKETYDVYKAVIPCHFPLEYRFCMGNHNLIGNQNQVNLFIPLCHFPIRSVNQAIIKALVADHKYSIKKNRGKNEGYHISKLSQFIREKNYKLAPDDLIDITLNYLRRDNNPQKHEFGTYNRFTEFDEDDLCYTSPSGQEVLTRGLDQFIMELTKVVV